MKVISLTNTEALMIKDATIKFNPAKDKTGWYISLKAAEILNADHGFNIDTLKQREHKPITI